MMICSSTTMFANSDDDFVYATYVVASRFESQENVKEYNSAEFDYIYLVAPPKWQAEDFDKSQEEVNAKYVRNHEYSKESYVDKYIKSVHKAGNKILCSFPGSEFIDIASSPQRRLRFAEMMAQYVKKFNFDGVELDWEHTIDLDLHIAFMADIRAAFDKVDVKERLLLTTALHSHHIYTRKQSEQLCRSIDWVNIMCYDMGGGCWEATKATHNSPLDTIIKQVGNWSHFPKDKICIGLANYGFYYKDLMPGVDAPNNQKMSDHGRYCNYTELPERLENGWYEQWDDVSQGSYFISADNDEFMTLESSRSIKAKMDWVTSEGFRGVFWWEFHCDWIPSSKGQRGTHLIVDEVTRVVKPNFFKNK